MVLIAFSFYLISQKNNIIYTTQTTDDSLSLGLLNLPETLECILLSCLFAFLNTY